MLKGKVFVSVVLTGMITGCGALTSDMPRGSNTVVSHVPMTRPEEVIVTHKLPADHVTFLELDDGRILMCNFADMQHKGGAATSGFSVSSDGGVTWGEYYKGREIRMPRCLYSPRGMEGLSIMRPNLPLRRFHREN